MSQLPIASFRFAAMYRRRRSGDRAGWFSWKVAVLGGISAVGVVNGALGLERVATYRSDAPTLPGLRENRRVSSSAVSTALNSPAAVLRSAPASGVGAPNGAFGL